MRTRNQILAMIGIFDNGRKTWYNKDNAEFLRSVIIHKFTDDDIKKILHDVKNSAAPASLDYSEYHSDRINILEWLLGKQWKPYWYKDLGLEDI